MMVNVIVATMIYYMGFKHNYLKTNTFRERLSYIQYKNFHSTVRSSVKNNAHVELRGNDDLFAHLVMCETHQSNASTQ